MASSIAWERIGISNSAGDAFASYVGDRLGVVLGRTGRGGTGVFFQNGSGDCFILTARHVVLAALRTGALTIGAWRNGRRTCEPSSIRIDKRHDAALITLPPAFRPPAALSTSDLCQCPPGLTVGGVVLSAGFPAAWKTALRFPCRLICVRPLYYPTHVESCSPTKNSVKIQVDGDDRRLPVSLRGMSGGPLFCAHTNGFRFAGINVLEIRRKAIGEPTGLICQTNDAFADLVKPYQPTGGITDYMRKCGSFTFTGDWGQDAERQSVRVNVAFERFWSQSNPEQTEGRIARITAVNILSVPGAERYPLNIESPFEYVDECDEPFLTQLQREIFFCLQASIRTPPLSV